MQHLNEKSCIRGQGHTEFVLWCLSKTIESSVIAGGVHFIVSTNDLLGTLRAQHKWSQVKNYVSCQC